MEITDRAILSAIVLTPGPLEIVVPLLRRLRSQSVCDRIEIVLVTPDVTALHPDQELLAAFACWQTVAVDAIDSMPAARAAGIRAARCPYIVFTEEHCFPGDGWGQAILDAFEKRGADVVGPVFGNGNPRLARSWAGLFTEYGRWMAPHPGGWMDHLPGHNSAYRRDQLLALGDGLHSAMESEFALHAQWFAQGRRLWLEPAASVRHVNITATWPKLASACAFQRPWANSRALHWGWPRRIAYALAFPLIPLVRLSRVGSDIRRTRLAVNGRRWVLLWVFCELYASAFGEFLGYLGSVGNAHALLVDVELYRRRYLSSSDDAETIYSA